MQVWRVPSLTTSLRASFYCVVLPNPLSVKGDYPSFPLEKDNMEPPNHFASGVSIALFFNEVRKMVI
jgi:hypothetical protein